MIQYTYVLDKKSYDLTYLMPFSILLQYVSLMKVEIISLQNNLFLFQVFNSPLFDKFTYCLSLYNQLCKKYYCDSTTLILMQFSHVNMF